MSVTENDRLSLRKGFAEVFNSERLAEIAMEAMPPVDYDSLATKRDLDAFKAELRGELKLDLSVLARSIGRLEGSMGRLEGALDKRLGQFQQVMVLTVLSVVGMLVTYALTVLG